MKRVFENMVSPLVMTVGGNDGRAGDEKDDAGAAKGSGSG
jgi:hypothetical protein